MILTPYLIFLLASENTKIEVGSIVKSTFFIVFIPVTLGLILRFIINLNRIIKYFPKISECIIAFIIAIIFSLNIDNYFLVNSKLICGVILHNLSGLFIGYLVATFLKYPTDVKKTIAIEIGMQNSGLGMTLAMIHFNKLVALPSAIFSLVHNISASGLVYLSKKK